MHFIRCPFRSNKPDESKQDLGWWRYYQFLTEPPLSTDPISTEFDLPLFINRESEIGLLNNYAGGNDSTLILVSGAAGVGKSSYIFRTFEGHDCYIRSDLVRAGDFSLAANLIVDDLLLFAREQARINTSDIERRYRNSVSFSTGYQFDLGGGPVPARVGIQDQTITTQRLSPFHTREIGQDLINRLHNKFNRLILFLDEVDNIPGGDREKLYSLAKYWNLQRPSTLILATRSMEARKSWQDAQSLERHVFHYHVPIDEMWTLGANMGRDILDIRFNGHYNDNDDWQFPFQPESVIVIDAFAKGNIREFIRLSRLALMRGASEEERKPLVPSYVFNILVLEFEDQKLSQEDMEILKYLSKTPSYASDEHFQKAVDLPRTTVQEKLSKLEEEQFIEMKIIKRKHIYSTTGKANLWLKYQK